jgi:hypothetical protein
MLQSDLPTAPEPPKLGEKARELPVIQ